MTLGLSEERGRVRRRRRTFWTTLRWLIAIGLIVAAGTWSYDIGTDLARQDVAALEGQLSGTTEQAEGLRVQVDNLAAELARTRTALAQTRRDVPTPAERELLDIVQERRAAGVDPERIAFVVANVAPTRDCDLEPTTRRFIANVDGAAATGNDTVSFASNTIAVTAVGEPARDAGGSIVGWFDPAQPVKATFTHISGNRTTATGTLPLQHSVVVGKDEFRFSLVAGARSFIDVTADRCAFP